MKIGLASEALATTAAYPRWVRTWKSQIRTTRMAAPSFMRQEEEARRLNRRYGRGLVSRIRGGSIELSVVRDPSRLSNESSYSASSVFRDEENNNNMNNNENEEIGVENEDNKQRVKTAYVAETNLPTDVGQFRLRAYRITDDPQMLDHILSSIHSSNGMLGIGPEPCVIYSMDKPPFHSKNVPVRIHDQCVTGEVFRSQR